MPLIVIDPGHGGSDPGATNGSYQEKNYTLSIGLKVRDYLLANYQTMSMTRTSDTTVRTTGPAANSRNRLFLFHINAGGSMVSHITTERYRKDHRRPKHASTR